MTRVGTLAPFYLQSRVITCPSAVLQRDRSANLSEILRASGLTVDVAITEYCSHFMVGGVKRFAAEQRKSAFVIYARTAQGIVGTFKIAVVECRMPCPYEWAEIQSGDESAIVKTVVVAPANGYLSLHDGILSALSVLPFVFGIYKVNIAVVAEGDVGCLYITPEKMEHGEVAVRSLGLPTVACQHNVLCTLAKSDESQSAFLYLHGVWCILSWFRLSNSLVVRIIHPIYRGSDVNLCPESIRATAIVSKLQCVNY